MNQIWSLCDIYIWSHTKLREFDLFLCLDLDLQGEVNSTFVVAFHKVTYEFNLKSLWHLHLKLHKILWIWPFPWPRPWPFDLEVEVNSTIGVTYPIVKYESNLKSLWHLHLKLYKITWIWPFPLPWPWPSRWSQFHICCGFSQGNIWIQFEVSVTFTYEVIRT